MESGLSALSFMGTVVDSSRVLVVCAGVIDSTGSFSAVVLSSLAVHLLMEISPSSESLVT